MYKAKDFNTRTALEKQIVSDYGRTVDKKDDTISGTTKQLHELQLEHGNVIWGVKVVASDYKLKNIKKVNRGKKFPSKVI